jgi:choline kinase
LRRLLHSPHADALAVEQRHRFDAEQMKVALNGDRVVKMSKTLPTEEAHAENLGVIKVSAAGAEVLFSSMEEILGNGGERQFAPYAFSAIAPDYPLHAVPVDGLPWTEIDFVEDLIHARETVWPAIQQRKSAAPASGPAREPGLSPANPSPLPGD